MKILDDAAMHDYVMERKAAIDARVKELYLCFYSVPLEQLLGEEEYDRLHIQIALKLADEERGFLESKSDEELGLVHDKPSRYE